MQAQRKTTLAALRPATGNPEPCWFSSPQSDTAPSHDPYLCQVNTTLDTKTKGAVVAYDTYNNLTDQYEYDFGNAPAVGANNPNLPYNSLTPTSSAQFNGYNQLTNYGYDNNGNLLQIGGYGLTYDAENRLVQANQTSPAASLTFAYDGDGHRVQKVESNGASTTYVYDAFDQLIAEYGSGVPSSPCGTCYLSWDHLGSTRLVTDGSGNVISRHDFLPFGDEVPGGTMGRSSAWGPGTDTITQKFTGQQRDDGPGMDFFNARYFASALLRFTSPDPLSIGADPYQPQSWNGYGYVMNNPLSDVDPDGLQSTASSCSGTSLCFGAGPIKDSSGSGSSGVGFSFGFSFGGGAPRVTTIRPSPVAQAPAVSPDHLSRMDQLLLALPDMSDASDFISGAGDWLSFGGTTALQDVLGEAPYVRRNSAVFFKGAVIGGVIGVFDGESEIQFSGRGVATAARVGRKRQSNPSVRT